MVNNSKYKIVTLCGSTKFKDDFIRVQKELTLEGNIVISVGLFGHSGDSEAMDENTKLMLDDMHKRKIDMADAIYVINKDGYVGESTLNEIDYALEHGKEIIFMEKAFLYGVGKYRALVDYIKGLYLETQKNAKEYDECVIRSRECLLHQILKYIEFQRETAVISAYRK